VVLRGGVSILADVWLYALDLEARGIRLSVEDGRLLAVPGDQLTVEDRQRIQATAAELARIVQYVPPALEVM
jgi:hypothetical protein